jgi:hypothetical protein
VSEGWVRQSPGSCRPDLTLFSGQAPAQQDVAVRFWVRAALSSSLPSSQCLAPSACEYWRPSCAHSAVFTVRPEYKTESQSDIGSFARKCTAAGTEGFLAHAPAGLAGLPRRLRDRERSLLALPAPDAAATCTNNTHTFDGRESPYTASGALYTRQVIHAICRPCRTAACRTALFSTGSSNASTWCHHLRQS